MIPDLTLRLIIQPIALLVIAMSTPSYCVNKNKTHITMSMAVMEKMVRDELKFLEQLRGFLNYRQLSKKPAIQKFLKTQTDKAVERKNSDLMSYISNIQILFLTSSISSIMITIRKNTPLESIMKIFKNFSRSQKMQWQKSLTAIKRLGLYWCCSACTI